MSNKIYTSAIVLSAGKGLRMGGSTPKQYMPLLGRPVLFYCLDAFEKSLVDEIIIVCGAGDEEYVRETIVNKYGFNKVKKIVSGGAERYDSVYSGLKACEATSSYVFIHDGARPLISPEMIEKLYIEVKEKKAVIAACPSKDTVKIADENGKVTDTPDRKRVWQVQTPQVFEYGLVRSAYEKMLGTDREGITDDAMVVERFSDVDVFLSDTGYGNIKITTAEDIPVAERLLLK